MREAHVSCDCSIAIDEGSATEGAVEREGAYSGASPYRPLPFDLRTPWALAGANDWFELPMYPANEGSIERFWPIAMGRATPSLGRCSTARAWRLTSG